MDYDALGAPTLTIASLRSLYQRRPTLYEHQRWAKDHLGLQDLDDTKTVELQELLAVASDQAAHLDDLIGTARTWLYDRRILIRSNRPFRAERYGLLAEPLLARVSARRPTVWSASPGWPTTAMHSPPTA